MSLYKIEGGTALSGKIKVHGAKNAALPILAATIINGRKSIIHNCPDLSDIRSIITILEMLGCKVLRDKDKLTVDSSQFCDTNIPDSIMRQTRSSSLFAGALLARTKRAFITGSGGCCIGKRPIDIHLKGFKELGIDVSFTPDGILCRAHHIKPGKITLDFPSVGATENLILVASLTPSLTVISNAAKEPEIKNLADYLRSTGVEIYGETTGEIYVKGTLSPKDGEVTIIPDRIVASTYLGAIACAGGSVTVDGISPSLLSPVLAAFRNMGMKINFAENSFSIEKPNRLINLPYVATGPYPEFPTDSQPSLISAMATSVGFGAVREKIFENRFGHCKRLSDMGADIRVNGRIAMIHGVDILKGTMVDACDLRSGAALTSAALGAEGTTYISNIHYIDRGYQDLCSDLKKLGAKIERID